MSSNINIPSHDKEFKEVEGGYYENGFYISPEGSFWDDDGVYFNKHGYDRHGGFYDVDYEYNPGKGWLSEQLCYEDELENKEEECVNENDDEDDGVDEIDVDDMHEEIDYGKLVDEETKTIEKTEMKKKILVFTKK